METLVKLGLANAVAATAIALVVAASGRWLTRRPAMLHCLWLLVLLKLVTPPLWDLPLPAWKPCDEEHAIVLSDAAYVLATADSLEGQPTSTTTEPEIAVPVPEPTGEPWSALVLPALGAIWIGGAVVTLAVAGIRVARFRRLLEHAYPVAPEIQDEVDVLAWKLGLRRVPRAWWIDARLTPMLWAVGCRPRVILPRDLWDRLDARQRSMLLVHELAHVGRGDHAVRLFELAVSVLFWWLPTVWWARRALHDVEEQCCDAWVTWAFPKDARSYAETLLETIDFVHATGSPEPILSTGFGKVHHLRKRLTMIMTGTTSRRLTWRGALGALTVGALLLPLSPSWAQKPDDQAEEKVVIVGATANTTDEVASPSIVTFTEPLETNIEVVVADENQKTTIMADSLEDAKKVLRERIETLSKEKGGSEAVSARIKVLKEVLADLEKSRARAIGVAIAGSDAAKGKESKEQARIYLRKFGDNTKATAETKVKIEKARARLEKIRAELEAKRKELVDAQRDLAKLSAEISLHLSIADPKTVEFHGKPLTIEKRIVTRVDKAPAGALTIKGGAVNLDTKDQERLASLEKKLAELLEQVAAMKKQGHGEKSEAR